MNDGWFVLGEGIVLGLELVLNCEDDDGSNILEGFALASLKDYIEIIRSPSKDPRSSCQSLTSILGLGI